MSLWGLCLRIPYHLRNIQRVEAGLHEPGTRLALRMVRALEASPEAFFSDLAAELRLVPDGGAGVAPDFSGLRMGDGCAFGFLLRHVRNAAGLAQRLVAERAGCGLRSLGNVEGGRQDPGVVRALRLVCAAGCEPGRFFAELCAMEEHPGLPDVRRGEEQRA